MNNPPELVRLNDEFNRAIFNHQKVQQMMKTNPEMITELQVELTVWAAKILEVDAKRKDIKKTLITKATGGVGVVESRTNGVFNARTSKMHENKGLKQPLQASSTNAKPSTQIAREHEEPVPSRSRRVLFNPKHLPESKTADIGEDEFENLDEADESILQPVVVTEEIRKEQFLRGLGLVTKEALSELQNKKTTRKRRTTANPHFSNEAIKAKRSAELEAKAQKAQRREMMNTRYSLKVDRRQRHHQNEQQPTRWKTGKESPNEDRKGRKRVIDEDDYYTELPDSLQITRSSKISRDCFVCSELCDCEKDTIMYCSPCRLFFHATCQGTFQELSVTRTVSCPNCDHGKSLHEQVTDMDAIVNRVLSELNVPHPSHKNLGKRKKVGVTRRESEPKFAARSVSPSIIGPSEQRRILKTKRKNETETASRENINSLYYEKRQELLSLVEKKAILELEFQQRREKRDQAKNVVISLRERNVHLSNDKEKLEKNINFLIDFVQSIRMREALDESVKQKEPEEPDGSPESNENFNRPNGRILTYSNKSYQVGLSPIKEQVALTNVEPKTRNIDLVDGDNDRHKCTMNLSDELHLEL